MTGVGNKPPLETEKGDESKPNGLVRCCLGSMSLKKRPLAVQVNATEHGGQV